MLKYGRPSLFQQDSEELRIGLICSAGGSVVGAAMQILRAQGFPITMAMITDRPCAAESLAEDFGIPYHRIGYTTREQFSRESACWLYDEQSVSASCLFFSRIVSRELYDRGECFNFHPALLPAFIGMRSLERTATSGARFFGATVHRVDETIDDGPIIGQIVSPMRTPIDLELMQRISFAQKLYLFLVLIEQLGKKSSNAPVFSTIGGRQHLASPGLSSGELERAFVSYVNSTGIPWEI